MPSKKRLAQMARDRAVTSHLAYHDPAAWCVAARECGLILCSGEDRSGQLKGWLSAPHEVPRDEGRSACDYAYMEKMQAPMFKAVVG